MKAGINQAMRRFLAGAGLAISGLALAGCAQEPKHYGGETGDLHLEYALPQANGEAIPYRLFVPEIWQAGQSWPLVVVLHGYGGNADSPFSDAAGQLQALAQQHRFLVLSPNGYNGMADYGANLPLPRTLGRQGTPLETTPQEESALAQADVLTVLQKVSEEYGVDPERIFLMGNSMGMTGVLHFVDSMPGRWCAVTASAGPPWPDYPVEKMAQLAGVLFVHGARDDIADPADTQKLAERALAAGVNSRMELMPQGTHGDAWIQYLPETFDFFADQDCGSG